MEDEFSDRVAKTLTFYGFQETTGQRGELLWPASISGPANGRKLTGIPLVGKKSGDLLA
jgi:hypothetical protein